MGRDIKQIPLGTIFGRWTTKSEVQRQDDTHTRAWVRVECTCGTLSEVETAQLLRGKSRSCGCLATDLKRKPVPPGTRFGRLVTISAVRYTGTEPAHVEVVCDCGKYRDLPLTRLTTGETSSCGCLQAELRSQGPHKTHGATVGFTAGGKLPKLYRVWVKMRSRCNDPNAQNYRWYGAKGIKVCDLWNDSFPAFEKWARDNGYADGLEIDRIESDDDYRPGNCRWVTKRQNIRNRDMAWDDELDARLVAYAASQGMNPYRVIRLAVEKFLSDV